MGTLDFLTPYQPKVKVYNHFNILYLNLIQNLYQGDNFSAIQFSISALDINGEIDTELDYQSYYIPRYNLNDTHETDEIPEYNLEIEIKNLNYKLEFTFIYETYNNPEGSHDNYSKPTVVYINNTTTQLESKAVNNNFRFEFLDQLQTGAELNIFFNTDPVNWNVGDVVANYDGINLAQILGTQPNTNPYIRTCTGSFFDAIRYVLDQPELPRIIFDGNFNELSLICNLNNNSYHMNLLGDLTFFKVQRLKELANQTGGA